MQNKLNFLTKAIFAFVASIALVGCASMTADNYLSTLTYPAMRAASKTAGRYSMYIADGVLFRGFVAIFRPDPDLLIDADGYEQALFWPSLEGVITEDGPLLTEYGGLIRFVTLDERYERYFSELVGEFIRSGYC